MAAYIGHLSTTSGDGPEVVIKLEGTDVVVMTPDEKLHVWPVDLVRITGVSSPRFRITFDGEVAVFSAHHPSRFLFEFVPALEAVRGASHSTATPDQSGAFRPEADDGSSNLEGNGGAGHDEAIAPYEAVHSSEIPPTRLRGSHWSEPDGTAMSSLLRAAASSSDRTRLNRASIDPRPQPKGGTEPQASLRSLPRLRRWLRRDAPCSHVWAPRTIAGRSAEICTKCSEVVLGGEPTNSVIDLTDDGLANAFGEPDSFRDRLSGRNRRRKRTAGSSRKGD